MNQLIDAVEICTKLEPFLREVKYHCGITGSRVYGLSKGKNDIDIVLYPHAGDDGRVAIEPEVMEVVLKELFPDIRYDQKAIYTHIVFKTSYNGTPVDFLFLP